jgi:hypothetical protein
MHETDDPRQYHQMGQKGQNSDGPARDWIGRDEYLALIEHLAVTFHSIAPRQTGGKRNGMILSHFSKSRCCKPG